jgi:hypothetical protein
MSLLFAAIYLAALLIRPQELFWALAPYNVMDILAGLAIGAAVLDILAFGSRPSLRQPQVVLLVTFVFWAAFSVAAAQQWFGGAWRAFEKLNIAIFAFLILVLGGTSLRRLTWLRRVMLTSMTLVLLLGAKSYFYGGRWAESFVLVQRGYGLDGQRVDRPPQGGTAAPDETQGASPLDWLSGKGRPTRLRAMGFLSDPNDLAQMLIALIPLAALNWRSGRYFRNAVIAGVPIAFFLFGIWLTRSRGGLVALVAMIAFALVLRFGGRAKQFLNVTIWAGLLLFLVLYFRMEMADGSALGRREAWSVGLGMLKESPVWGAGFGAFADADRVAHNSFVHCFGELGLVGYWLWLTALLVTLRQLRELGALEAHRGKDSESLARWATALQLSLLSFLVSSLFLSRTYSPTLFILLGLPTALAGISRRRGIRSGPRHLLFFALQTAAFSVGTVLLSYVLVRAMW